MSRIPDRWAARRSALGARWRLRLARSRWLAAAIVMSLAAGAGLVAARAVAGIEDRRDAWGESQSVWVATGDVAPGQSLEGTVELRQLPAPMVAPSALDAEMDATLRVARQAIGRGEVLVSVDVAAPPGPLALIPLGWLAVPVAETVASGAATGTAVQVASGGIIVATDAVVVGREPVGSALLVAVPADAAAMVAQASASGDAVVLQRG